ncbi:MAG: gliding motility-associated C-terminal domain-containing protein [Bacteroidetes bacterium]|nr:gliding motility-associated C-terminal domain-containing protein [Bacteroidota bacterium]
MKKIYSALFSVLLSLMSFGLHLESFGQSTVSTTVYYTGFQACGGCTVCGMDYWCFNTLGSYCGNTGPCGTQAFFDPVPPGNLVTNIQVQYYSAECSGGGLTATINGNSVPTVYEGATGCWCSNNPCAVSATSSSNYPCGMPGYVYGGNNSLQLCTGADVCVNKIVLIITYYLPSAINPSITASGPINFCPGGSVVLDAGAGYAAYSWNTGANTQTINVTTAGTYVVTVTSLSGCTSGSASITVNVFANPAPNITANGPLTFCQGGSVVLDAGAGYTNYSWTTGANTQTISVSASGTYGVTVTDANGCVGSASINVTASPMPSVSASSTQAGCTVANGTATANPSGGTPNYTYLWSNGDANQTANNLSAGTYNVTVTDANGCTAQTSVTVTTANGPSVSATTTQAGCTVANGTATANPSGGTPNYTYLWSNGDANQTANNLSAGTYVVTVTDANGCTAQTSVTITIANGPSVSASSTVAGCTMANGTATANPSGGTPNYTYLWSNGTSNQTANNLSAGTYSVTVTDANGCTAQTSVTIAIANSPSVSASSTVAGCTVANGTATANPTGGTPNYTYLWSNGTSNQTANNLSAGTYIVTVTDANGCTAQTSVTVTTAVGPTTTASVIGNASCNGGSNGSASAFPSGGTAPYTYSWSTTPVQNSQIATGLSAGTYVVTVTDANGCTAQSSVTISQPQPLSALTTPTDPLCYLGNNGSATVSVTFGTAPYTYLWSTFPPQNTQTATGLSAGNYNVSIIDANGCTTQASVTVSEPQPITFSVNGDTSICAGENAILTAIAGGGTSPYTFVWVPGPQNGDTITVNPSSSSSYTVAMTDANGCASSVQIFNVNVNPAPTALFDSSSTGTFSAVYSFTDLSTGGTSWSWDFGDGSNGSTAQNPVHTFPGAATYTVTQIVFNQYGCPDTFRIIINFNEGILIPNVFTPDNDGVNDVWYIPNSGMKEFHVEIFDRWGAKVFETTADEIRWDGHSTSGKLLNDATYYFVLHAILKSGSIGKDYSTQGYVTLLTGNRKK